MNTSDPANRLSTLNDPSSMVSYTYNGRGDRLQEIADGSTTTFSMDLNTGLTQALSVTVVKVLKNAEQKVL